MTTTYNVTHGGGRASRMDWQTFKERLKTYRGLDYDSATKQFYFMDNGRRHLIGYRMIVMLACNVGCYDDLTDYLDLTEEVE